MSEPFDLARIEAATRGHTLSGAFINEGAAFPMVRTDRGLVAEVFGNTDEVHATTHLIAAAPLLLAECRRLTARIAELEAAQAWVPCSAFLPPPHEDVWCLNRDGRQFAGRICYGMHKPFFTYPHGDGSPSNTAPNWIDVTHWRPLPAPPKGGT